MSYVVAQKGKKWWFMAAGREKKLICDTKEEKVVVHGRLPSRARLSTHLILEVLKKRIASISIIISCITAVEE